MCKNRIYKFSDGKTWMAIGNRYLKPKEIEAHEMIHGPLVSVTYLGRTVLAI